MATFQRAMLCGPDGMRAAARQALVEQGLAADRIVEESFSSPRRAKVPSGPQTATLTGPEGVQIVVVPGDRTLLEAALDAGVSISFSCCSGGCGACRVNVTEHPEHVVLDEPNEVSADDRAKGAVPACLARLRGPIGFSVPSLHANADRSHGRIGNMSDRTPRVGSGDPPAFQLVNELGIIDQLAQHRAAQLLAPELNMPQFIVLNHLVRRGSDAAQIDLARAMQVTKGAMSNTVARLLENGYIAVQADPNDGRGKRVSLSAEGRRARDRAVAKLGRGLDGVAEMLSAQEVEQTLAVLRKLRIWFDERR